MVGVYFAEEVHVAAEQRSGGLELNQDLICVHTIGRWDVNGLVSVFGEELETHDEAWSVG